MSVQCILSVIICCQFTTCSTAHPKFSWICPRGQFEACIVLRIRDQSNWVVTVAGVDRLKWNSAELGEC
jgi:hypothetical protein